MFSEFFIRRPKFAFVVSIVMMLAGLICLTQMPVSEYPEVSPPTVSVRMTYAGASSEELAEVVAAPVEEQLIGMDDLLYFYSSCTNDGTYSLTLIFDTDSDADMDMVNVSNAIKQIESKLPSEIKQTGYSVRKRSGDMLCFVNFMCDENKMSVLEMSNWLRMNVRDRVSRVDGVAQSSIIPNRDYAMRVWMNTVRMSALGITPADVRNAIAAQNIQAAAGSVGSQDEQSYATYKVTATGRLKTAEEFGNIIVKRGQKGHVTKLRDIATIELGAENNSGYSRLNGKDAVGMIIHRNNDANALETVQAVQKLIREIEPTFPEGMTWTMGYDPTLAIQATMDEIIETLVVALLLVVLVTYLFLQDWRATLIPALAIPVSLLGAFTVMLALGYTINVLTMFGLILVIGSLVDDAIIVVENVMRLIQDEKLSPKEATIKSMKQITGAVIATTLVTLAVYIPIAFYGGMVGIIYTQFSVTMCVALVISSFNALTLSPALCALILRPVDSRPSRIRALIFAPFNWSLEMSRRIYLRGAAILVRNAWLTILLLAGVLYGNYAYFSGAPQWWNHIWRAGEQDGSQAGMKARSTKKESGIIDVFAPKELNSSFIPTEDKGSLFVMVTMEGTATAKQRTDKVMREIEQRVAAIPGVLQATAQSGYSFSSGSGENNGMMMVQLTPWDERKDPELFASAIAAKINAACADIPQANVMAVTPPAIRGLGLTGGISMVLQGSGDATPLDLDNMVKTIRARLEEHRDLVARTSSEYTATNPQVRLEINREKAQTLNVPVNTIFSTLQSVMASSYVNDFTLNGFNFKVKIQGSTHERRTADDILNQMVRNEKGEMVPLSAVCTLSYTMGPTLYSRFEQYMSADITVMAAPGVGSGQVMKLIEQTVADINKEERAKGHNRQWMVAWKDLSYQERQNAGRIGPLIGMALLFAYLFLVAQYESWTTPISVMLSVSVATLGALMAAQLCGLSLSIYVQLGLLMLIGLAGKNAILMVEFSKEDHEAGTPIREAALNGASLRFRAVMMTAISFIIGVFPMVVATGSGAASRQEIGITTFAGMVLATVFGIFMVPGLYAIIARMRDATYRLFRRKA